MGKKKFQILILSAITGGSLFTIYEAIAQGPTPVAPTTTPTPVVPPAPTSPCANACKELVDHFKLTVAGKYNVLCGDFKCKNLYNSCEDYCIPNPFLR